MIVNPSFVYIFSFSIAIFLYIFGWASIYPKLGASVFLFFISTFFMALVFSVFFKGRSRLKLQRKFDFKGFSFEYLYIFGFVFEFFYSKSIPFFEIISGNDFDYSKFGVPVAHVVILTYASAVGVIRFYNYVLEGGLGRFLLSIFPLLMFLLIYNRGALAIQMVSYLFIYCCLNKVRLKFVFLLTPVFIFLMYFFGVLGNLRSGVNIMEDTLQPTNSFYNLNIPKEFLWVYSYITSPISNFELTVEKLRCESSSNACNDFAGLVVSEFLPDVIGKRIAIIFDIDFQVGTPLVVDNLNVATTFSRAYAYFGWIGAYLMFFCMFGFLLLFEKMFKNSKLHVPVRAIMCSVIAFSFFANMISSAGILLQLFWMIFFRRLVK